jgi:hypothetical protein
VIVSLRLLFVRLIETKTRARRVTYSAAMHHNNNESGMSACSLQHGGICFTIVEEKSTRYTGVIRPPQAASAHQGEVE